MDTDLIGNCLFLKDRLFKADVAIVFGMNDCQRPAERAIELYRSSQVDVLLFTGGYNHNLAACESVEMSMIARQSGVPDHAVLVETRATHTDDNMALSAALLNAHENLADVKTVILVTIHYHLRRAILAARRHLPASVEIGWASYPSRYYSAADWHQSVCGRANIASELEKIEGYYGMSLTDLAVQIP